MFMPDKSHRYGSKMFMTCDSKTAYCHRFDIYVGKMKAREDQADAFDHKTGAAAVITIDRFYSSIPLDIELLSMHVYVIGTIMTGRL
ncbi:Hypothetical protein PHPALM_3849, partial [Phytophthora palmivora]